MKRITPLVMFGLAAALLCSLLFLVPMSPVNAKTPPAFAPGRLIVQLEPGKSAARLIDDFTSVGLHPIKPLSRRLNLWLFAYDTPTAKSSDPPTRILNQVRAHRSVRLAQFDHLISERSTLPNDPLFVNQWNLHNTGQTGGLPDADIDAPEAWDLTTSGITAGGDQIVVAVIDAGCDLTHPDIPYFKNLAETPGNGVDDDANGYVDDYDGWNAVTSTGNVVSSDHGTHVAGIAAALGNNSVGVCGVNWNVRILPIVGSTIYESVAVEAYAYALEMRARYNETDGLAGAFVVATNSSFGVDYGDPVDFPVWCAMYDSLGAYGVLSAGAAPNINLDVDIEGDIPTACPSDYLIAVTNTTSSDNRNSASGYGDTSIDLGAPGTSVFSALQGGGYGFKTGASMASPHVAGAIAFAYSVADADLIDYARVYPDSVALSIRQAILDGVDTLPALTGLAATNGRLNLHRAALNVIAIPAGLIITHQPLPDTRDTVNPYLVIAKITSDTLLIPDSLAVHYSVDGLPHLAPLQPEFEPDTYSASLPPQLPGTTIEYTVHAADLAGRIDSIGPFAFRIIDYEFAVRPSAQVTSGLFEDTLRSECWLINTGLRPDEFSCVLTSSLWPTRLIDSSGSLLSPIVGPLDPGESLLVSIEAVVVDSEYLSVDTASVEITSVTRPSLTAGLSAVALSEGIPHSLPFTETFPDPFLAQSLWVKWSGVTLDDLAMNPPSPLLSLHLDGNADTIVSCAIPLHDLTAALFSLSYQRGGSESPPGPDDSLRVEFVDSLGNWRTLIGLEGDGTATSSFALFKTFLPADARHRLFRFRIVSDGSPGALDDWFVDDITVDAPPPHGVALSTIDPIISGPSGSTVFHRLTLQNQGASPDSFALQIANDSSWFAGLYDSTGTQPATVTGTILPGDSIPLLAMVTIPPDAFYGASSVTEIVTASVSDPATFASLAVQTASVGALGSIPWFEPFASATLDSNVWPLTDASVVSADLAAPSLPYVLRLDGADTVASQPIDLSAATDVLLSLWYARAASDPPDPGEYLRLEYQDSLKQWIILDTLPADGQADSRFVRQVYVLGPDALHAAFRLRLRSEGSCDECDIWLVDDIRIDFPPAMTAFPAAFSTTLSQADTAVFSLIIANEGAGELAYTLSREIPLTPRGIERSDNHGYSWITSDDPFGPLFSWLDIASSGIDLSAALADDTVLGPYPIGFPFKWFDTVVSELYLSSNGLVAFSPVGADSRDNMAIPDLAQPNSIIAWCWDDLNPLDPANPGAGLHFLSDSDRCIVQYTSFPGYSAPTGGTITAQVVLQKDGSMLLQYIDIGDSFDPLAGTVGIESPDGTSGLLLAHDTPFLKDSLAVLINNPFLWLSVSPSIGTVPPGAADTVSLTVYPAGLDTGSYFLDLYLTPNDPRSAPIILPVTIEVISFPTYICGDVNGNALGPDVADLTYLVTYLFRGGAAPPILEAADINGSGGLPTVSDLTYLVSFLFKGGNPPFCDISR